MDGTYSSYIITNMKNVYGFLPIEETSSFSNLVDPDVVGLKSANRRVDFAANGVVADWLRDGIIQCLKLNEDANQASLTE